METPDFEVVISGVHVNPEAWKRAADAPHPELSQEQKVVARKLGVGEDEFARGVLASQMGEEYQRGRGKTLGQRIQAILASVGSEYLLSAVMRQGTEFRWLARIEAAGKTVAVSLPLDLVDDVVDSGSKQELDRLRNLVLFGIGRQELIFNH
jgi:hypothetical protein